jgi:nucleoid-associated protein YgaU
MARETKVGLLAGLAFIICFAIILANRGRQDPPASPRSHLTDGGANVPGAVQQTATRVGPNPSEHQRQSTNGRLVPPTSTPPDAAVARLDRSTSNPPATSGADLLLPESGAGGISPIAGNLIDGGTSAGNQPTERALTSHTQDDLVRRQELERLLRGSGQGLGILEPDSTTNGGPKPQSSTPPQPVSTAKSVQYTVAPGDTLSKIALAHFGNKSRTSVNTIFDANRSTLASPDDLKAGLVLSLPVVEGMVRLVKSEPPKASSPTSSKTEEAKNHPTKKSAEPRAATYRWYQVKKNDRYSSIAREQLGDAGRWRELHELNKDKFPNPQSIREGVRIKLPAAKVLASAEGRR